MIKKIHDKIREIAEKIEGPVIVQFGALLDENEVFYPLQLRIENHLIAIRHTIKPKWTEEQIENEINESVKRFIQAMKERHKPDGLLGCGTCEIKEECESVNPKSSKSIH